MSDVQKPASATAKEKKLMLFPGDPLIKILKPDYYVVVDPGTLDIIYDFPADASEADPEDDPSEADTNPLAAPSLSDITLVSKNIVTDSNKNQFIEFVFNVKNSGGDTVVGVEAYGQ